MNAIGGNDKEAINSCAITHGGSLLLLDTPILEELSDTALEALAQNYAKVAGQIRNLISERRKRQHNKAQHDAHQEEAKSAAYLMGIRIEAGDMTYDTALAATARESGLDVDMLAQHFRHYIREKNKFARLARDVAVLRMARTKKNTEIAAELDLHPSTVSTIIQGAFRK